MNDLRDFIKIIESTELNEGIFDRILANLPGDIGASASGRVDREDLANLLRSRWIKHASAINVDRHNKKELKTFFNQLGFDNEVLKNIRALRPKDVNLKDVFSQAAVVLQRLAGPEGAAKDQGAIEPPKQKQSRSKKPSPSKKQASVSLPKNDSDEEIIRFYRDGLSGNLETLKAEVTKIKDIDALDSAPLAALGYAYLKAGEAI